MADYVNKFEDEAYANLLQQGYESNDMVEASTVRDNIIGTPTIKGNAQLVIDMNHDGIIDENELRAAQRKYHDQIDLNTSLMQEIEKITKENNQHLEELKEKEHTLQSVMQTLEEVRVARPRFERFHHVLLPPSSRRAETE